MQLASALDAIVEAGIPAAGRFGSALNAEWVDGALSQTGTMSVRRRRLPARLVVWLVVSMALFRDCAIRTVATHLGLSNPWGSARRGSRARSVAASAVAKSRQRLGDKPMQLIFERSAVCFRQACVVVAGRLPGGPRRPPCRRCRGRLPGGEAAVQRGPVHAELLGDLPG